MKWIKRAIVAAGAFLAWLFRRACPLAGRSGSVAESVSLDFCIARPCLSMVDGLVRTTVEAYSTAAICAT